MPTSPDLPSTAVVVGSGPNGLAAALTLAERGVRVRVLERAATPGGGMRSADLTGRGLVHDVCSGLHPTAMVSPFFAGAGLEAYGLRWSWPDIDLVHVLDDGRGAAMHRDLDATCAGLEGDGPRWRRLVGPLAERADDLVGDLFGPVTRVPSHPLLLARFGALGGLPATVLARAFSRPETRGLFAGLAAHTFGRLDRPLTGGFGLMFAALGHRAGWPVAVGGSEAIARAMLARLTDLGGEVETGSEVADLDDVGDADVVLLDVAPRGALRILGDRLPGSVRRGYGRYRYGPAALKVDYAVRSGVPWSFGPARRAGTVHVGGTIEAIAAAEARAVAGRLPTEPFVLVGQQYLADPGRAAGGLVPLYAYAHVPNGWAGTPEEGAALVDARIERHAPGFTSRVVERAVRTPTTLEGENPNYVGGDIATGGASGLQALLRPRPTTHPYDTGVPGVYLCSAATPPGAGVHGMAGLHAARRAVSAHAAGRRRPRP